jgi:hypothetical protein
MLRRSLAVAVASAAFLLPFASAIPTLAQSATGEIDLLVLDVATQKPLGNARSILQGAQTANSLTTASGLIKYTDVPIGIYRIRVLHSGYNYGATREFDVLPDRAVEVRVELEPRTAATSGGAAGTSGGANASSGDGGLRTIAVVAAHARISITSTDINDNSPVRRLSDSLTDALDKLAGVSVTTDATDPTSAVTISLHNQDESQTSLSLDGIPLAAPGTAGNLRGIGSDLFSGSSVGFSPSAGGLAGGVGFRTLEPTQAMQFRAAGTTGTFDRSNYSVATTGSIGSLGFALQHTWRGSNSPLTFQDYEDQSGLTYPHGGESTALGDLVKLRYRLGDERTTVTATALTNNRDASAICARDVTLLPCGIGPGNGTYGRYGFAYATVASLIGDIQTTFSAYANSSTQTTDDVNRYVLDPFNNYEPTLDPSLATNLGVTRGFSYSGAIAQGNHTFSLSGTTYASINTSTPIAGSQFETPFTNAAASTTYKFSDAIKSNDRLTLTPSLSLADTTGLGTSVLSGVAATWTPRGADAYGLSVNAGSSQPNLSANRSFSDPNNARFDCQAQTAVVSAPGDTGTGQRQSAFSVSTQWSHQFRGGATVNADAYSQVQSGQLINALIEEPLSIYPAGFLQELDSAYRAPTVCGAAAAVPTVFASESVAGTRRVYQGFDVSGRFALSPYITVLPSYSLNLAILGAASGRLDNGPSTTIVGAQLPNRPIHRAGVTLDGLLPRSGLELLANAQYTGANNQQNLGPYVNVSLGASHRLGPGQVTLFENNVFNTYGADCASDAFAQPLGLSDGRPFQTAANPLTPRSIFLSYSVAAGGPAPGPAFSQFARGARSIAQAPQPSPSESPRPRLGRFTPFPPPAGVDPLSLATARDSCTADVQPDAKPVLDGIRAYATAYEGNQTLPATPNFTIAAHKVTGDPMVPYYLEVRPNFPRPPGAPSGNSGGGPRLRGGFGGPGGPGGGPPDGGPPGGGPQDGPVVATPGSGATPSPANAAARAAFQNSPGFKAFRGFTSCAYISVMSSADAKAKGIVLENGRPGLIYIPNIGMTFVQPPELPVGGGSLKTVK